jgi:hypothetical protein
MIAVVVNTLVGVLFCIVGIGFGFQIGQNNPDLLRPIPTPTPLEQIYIIEER